MRGLVRRQPRVERDLLEHFLFILADKAAPADAFLDAAEAGFQLLAEYPLTGREWGSVRPQLRGVRIYPLPSPYRNYVVFYRAVEGAVEVLAVLRGEREAPDAFDEFFDDQGPAAGG